MNRTLAKEKLIKMIQEALEQPTYRLKTRPSKSVKSRRKRQKVQRSELKVLRTRIKM